MPDELALLQGGPKHLHHVRVPEGQEEIVLDQGKLPPVTYRRRADNGSVVGALFDFVPAKAVSPVA